LKRDRTPRYAIYYTPPRLSRLAQFGAHILGYDCYLGADVAHSALDDIDPAALALITEQPRRYGFHATIVAPFALNEQSEADLAEELLVFSRARAPVSVGALVISTISRFVALVPAVEPRGISELADDCLRAFDRYRAPLSQSDRDRRSLGGALTSHQLSLMDRWGYPYVLDEFRFHMTLAGPLPEHRMDAVKASLSHAYEELAHTNHEIDALSLMRQDDRDQPFKVIDRCRLCGTR
jgi:putative phosphonate metabolism protein